MSARDIAAAEAAMLEGFYVINKPSGITSFKLIASLKKRLDKGVRVGHAGTLDSFARGVLIVLIGRYTRLSDYFMAAGKGYEATLRFGSETDTLDPEGAVVAEAAVPSRAALEAVLPSFAGDIMQAPPAYSAVHIEGQRAYERARRGEDVKPELRPVSVHKLELLSFDGKDARLLVHCSKGTYIRSLARDIALACGSRAHLVALKRTFSGPFRLEDALEPEELEPSRLQTLDASLARALGLQSLALKDDDARAFANGLPLARIGSFADSGSLDGDRALAAFSQEGRLLGIAQPVAGLWRYAMVFEGSA
jgi:tRNA pseudouridine55 synthase